MRNNRPIVTCPEEEAYLAYIDEHCNNVLKAFIKDGVKNFTGTAGQQRIGKDFIINFSSNKV